MTTATRKLITAEEFAQLPPPPDGSRQELVRGVIETMPPPGFRHGAIQSNFLVLLGQHARSGRLGRVTAESGVRTQLGPDSVRGPDVAFWSAERLPLDQSPLGYPDVVADLCVEILSPGQSRKGLREKVKEYLEAGVRMVWIADPELCSVTIYRTPNEARVLHEGATITGEEVLPGFSCPIKEFFA
jgi:Uma2 family endonuclease